MTDVRTASVVAAITARFPGLRVELLMNPAPELPTMPHILAVLDVPAAQSCEVVEFGLDVAFAVFGDDPLPFLVDAFDPEASKRVFRNDVVEGRVAES